MSIEHEYAQSESNTPNNNSFKKSSHKFYFSPRVKHSYGKCSSFKHNFSNLPNLRSPTSSNHSKKNLSISLFNPKFSIQNNNITGSQISRSKLINNSYLTFKGCNNYCDNLFDNEDNKTESNILCNVFSDIAFSNEQSSNFQKKTSRHNTSSNNIQLINYQSGSGDDNVSSYLEGLEKFKLFRKVSKPQVYAKDLGSIKGFSVYTFKNQKNKNEDKIGISINHNVDNHVLNFYENISFIFY